MSDLMNAIKLAAEAANTNISKEAGVADKAVKAVKAVKGVAKAVKGKAKKMTKKQKIVAALAAAGVFGTAGAAMKKKASLGDVEDVSDIELAKMAAYELGCEALEKLAYAEQLFDEATFVDEVYVKQAADASELELESDGSALESFLQELETEEDVEDDSGEAEDE